MYQIRKVAKQTRGRRYTIINLIFMVFQPKCIGHACSSWHFCHGQKYSKCPQTSSYADDFRFEGKPSRARAKSTPFPVSKDYDYDYDYILGRHSTADN